MSFGLGRGLEALIPNNKKTIKRTVPSDFKNQKRTGFELPIDKITPNPLQPRKKFDLKKLQELADSIKENGLIEPLVVSPGKSEDTYVLVAGERRLRACELAGLPRVPVSVRQTNDQEKLELALVENIQREDLNPLEEARAIRKLIREFGLNQPQAARKIGRSRPALSNCLRLLELSSEAQRALLEDKISAGHARALLGIENKTKQVEVLRQAIDQNMSVRKVERLVRKISRPLNNKSYVKISEIGSDAELKRISGQLSEALGARVNIVSAPKGGRIVVEYYSDDERGRIIDLILRRSRQNNTTDLNRKQSGNFSV